MSESIVRKVQPFTIGTKLSVPAVPKCTDFAGHFLPSQVLDNRRLPGNQNERVPLYLDQTGLCGATADPSPAPAAAKIPVQVESRRREEVCEEDALNRNTTSPTAASRSIRKITISGSVETTGDTVAPTSEPPRAPGACKLESINNNNINNNNNNTNNIFATKCLLPRIVGVTCENKPNSHFKVQKQAFLLFLILSTHTWYLIALPLDFTQLQTGSASTFSFLNKEKHTCRMYVDEKLEDLNEDCGVQRGPPQHSEKVSQTLQRDLKDFENNLIRLNQMGEQLASRSNPTSDPVQKQLGQLREQWHVLRQTAAGQAKAPSGAPNLQEFNKKAEQLEIWIKEKEEEHSLVKVLGENIDKVQLTRRILDLKQDEQQYRSLHEEINHLALKLEKQSKAEGRNVSARRKQINKMWLKVQTLLKDYHESLQLALEVSSFYQQADSILAAISDKVNVPSVTTSFSKLADVG
ncbi:hypothetical protein GN956_G11502 [Arapaima gigas]